VKPIEEAVILAGGLGTRLRSVVSDVPKPLAPVAGRPFLAWLLDRLTEQGVRRTVLATGYLSQKIEAAIGKNWRGMDIAYSVEHEPLGTGGALMQAVKHLRGQVVHVSNGDTYLHYSLRDLQQVTEAQGALAGMALASVADTARYGAVTVQQGRVLSFQEKGQVGPGYINAGSYYLSREGLAALHEHASAGAFSLETAFLHPLASAGGLAATVDTSGFIDIGVPEDYALAQTWFETPRV
jgi:D-glycero-alpha-D-manno-heptose 1-phosphate guanylyltransferase